MLALEAPAEAAEAAVEAATNEWFISYVLPLPRREGEGERGLSLRQHCSITSSTMLRDSATEAAANSIAVDLFSPIFQRGRVGQRRRPHVRHIYVLFVLAQESVEKAKGTRPPPP